MLAMKLPRETPDGRQEMPVISRLTVTLTRTTMDRRRKDRGLTGISHAVFLSSHSLFRDLSASTTLSALHASGTRSALDPKCNAMPTRLSSLLLCWLQNSDAMTDGECPAFFSWFGLWPRVRVPVTYSGPLLCCT